MSVSSPFIHRPIATSLLGFAVMLGGLLGYLWLPVASLPQVDFPTIQVRTQLPGALPYPPVYSKVNPADTPIITLAITSPTISLRALSDLADSVLASRLSELTGVGRVTVQGGIRPAVRIQVDLARLANYGIGLEDIRQVIVAANVAGPKGSLDGAHQSYTISSNDQILAADAYANVVVTYRNGAPVLLKDVADIVDGPRQPGANVIETVQRIQRELPRLQRAFPAGATLTVVHDATTTIRASIRDVQFTLVLSVALVIMVVFVFLRTIRATIIAGVALPLSLIATFGIMWFCGFSLDNLSLMALTIGTGFVIDDAIVMIENIVRHMEDGEDPFQAALEGAREIGFTVISLTLSLIAVFIPLLFMTGIVGRMFREFALTLTIAVVTSAVVSLTLTPMMCSRLLRRQAETTGNTVTRSFNRAVEWTVEVYRRSLDWVLRHETLTLMVTLATLLATVWLYLIIPKGFLPLQDTGLVFAVMEGGEEVSFTEMQRLRAEVEGAIRKDADVTGVVSVVGVTPVNATPNAARLAITLRSRDVRNTSVTAVIARLQREVAAIPGVIVYFQPVQDIQISTRVSRAQYQYTLTGADPKDVSHWADKLADEMQKSPVMREVASEAQDNGLRMNIVVDREIAGRLGVSLQAVNDTLSDAFGQRQISTIYAQSNQYRVILEAMPQYQSDPSSLSKLYVPASGNQATQQSTSLTAGATPLNQPQIGATQVPLSAFARFEHTTAPLVIAHQEQFPAVTISFNLAPEAALSDGVRVISSAERDIGMPTSVIGSYSGDAAEFAKSLEGEPWLILAAVIAIYIVLGVLYESFIHPLTILSTLPSAGVGALLALMLFGHDLSVIALIGIVLLMGIVKKNAIMMIDFALEAERGQGLSPREAIVQASLLRFRPIMMTTLAALFGAIPLAIEGGTGAELRNPLGITIVGGLLLSQLLTLYTTPVIYLQMDRLKTRLGGRLAPRKPPAASQPAE